MEPKVAVTFVIPPSDEWRGFGDLSFVRFGLPVLVLASRCKAGTYQQYAFQSRVQQCIGHLAHQHVAQFDALRTVFAGRVYCHVAFACCCLWTSAPANTGLGLAPRIGRATGMTKRLVPEGVLGQS